MRRHARRLLRDGCWIVGLPRGDLANKTHRITEGGKWERRRARGGRPAGVVAFLREQFGKHAEGLVRTTEEEAQRASGDPQGEKAIDLYEAFFPYSTSGEEQGSHVDGSSAGRRWGASNR